MEALAIKRMPTLLQFGGSASLMRAHVFMKNSLPIKTHAKVRRALRGLKEEPLNEMEDGHIFGGRYHM